MLPKGKFLTTAIVGLVVLALDCYSNFVLAYRIPISPEYDLKNLEMFLVINKIKNASCFIENIVPIRQHIKKEHNFDLLRVVHKLNFLLDVKKQDCNHELIKELINVAQHYQKSAQGKGLVDGVIRQGLKEALDSCQSFLENLYKKLLENSISRDKKQTLLDRLGKNDLMDLFATDKNGELDQNLDWRKWPIILRKLLSKEEFKKLNSKKSLSLNGRSASSSGQTDSPVSAKRLEKLFKTLKELCLDYNDKGFGLLAELTPAIMMFQPYQYDASHGMPLFFQKQHNILFQDSIFRYGFCLNILSLSKEDYKRIRELLADESSLNRTGSNKSQ